MHHGPEAPDKYRQEMKEGVKNGSEELILKVKYVPSPSEINSVASCIGRLQPFRSIANRIGRTSCFFSFITYHPLQVGNKYVFGIRDQGSSLKLDMVFSASLLVP